jgi:hypothetical protein
MNRVGLMKLASAPALAVALAAMSGCDNVQRSLVFATGTTVGVEVALKPQSEAPLNLVIGYKRAEVLFDPIMDDAESTDPDRKYDILQENHSVMAKLLGQINGSGTTGTGQEAKAGVSVAQWFASGKAAEILAENGGAAALTDDPKVAEQVAEAMKIAPGVGHEGSTQVRGMLDSIYRGLGDPPLNADEQATKHREKLNTIARFLIPARARTLNYYHKWNPTTKELTDFETESVPASPDFQWVIGYLGRWEKSATNLKEAAPVLSSVEVVKLDGSRFPNPNTGRDMASTNLADYQSIFEEFDRRVRNDPDVFAAVQYYRTVLFE